MSCFSWQHYCELMSVFVKLRGVSEWFSVVVTIIECHLDRCADRGLCAPGSFLCVLCWCWWSVSAVAGGRLGGSWYGSRLADGSSWDSDPEYSTHSSETLSSAIKQLQQGYSPIRNITHTNVNQSVFRSSVEHKWKSKR